MAALSLKEFYHKYGTGVHGSWDECEQIWKAATEYAEENCHSLQQLKAEISALITDIGSPNGNVRHGITIREVIERLRQLSAV